MLEDLIVSGVITGLIVSISSMVAYRLAKRDIKNEVYAMLDSIQTDEEIQKALYSIGALISQGAKGGFGLNKKSGKFSLQDLVLQIAGQYIGGKLEQPQSSMPNLFESKGL
jgi:hypothetical protein